MMLMSEKYIKRIQKGKGRKKKNTEKWIQNNLPAIINKSIERSKKNLTDLLDYANS